MPFHIEWDIARNNSSNVDSKILLSALQQLDTRLGAIQSATVYAAIALTVIAVILLFR